MRKKIVAIGGGENGRLLENGKYAPYETENIDKEIVSLTEKETPNFLFIAHSQAQSIEIQESYFQTMKKIYGEKLHCNCRDLKSSELNNIEDVKEIIKWADIIYEGGGDTKTMIDLWKRNGFDKILYDAWIDGKVISGISAGAVCWFKACSSESLTVQEAQYKLEDTNCLDWFNLYFTPHGNEEGRYEITKAQLRKNGLVGILLSNCVALEIIDNKYRLIIGNSNEYKAYGLKTYWDGDKYKEKEIIISNEFDKLTNLLNRE